MVENKADYAQLRLYFATCKNLNTNWGGIQFADPNNKRFGQNSKIFIEAKKIVQENFDKKRVKLGSDRLVEDDDEAQQFIIYARKNIPQAHDAIEMVDCTKYGDCLRFFRTVKFNGWMVDQEEDLITKCKESGIIPVTIRPGSIYCHDSRPFDENKPWQDAMRFYEGNVRINKDRTPMIGHI